MKTDCINEHITMNRKLVINRIHHTIKKKV